MKDRYGRRGVLREERRARSRALTRKREKRKDVKRRGVSMILSNQYPRPRFAYVVELGFLAYPFPQRLWLVVLAECCAQGGRG